MPFADLKPSMVLNNDADLSLFEEINRLRQSHGDSLLLLAHHYQRPEIALLGDARGDSFELARIAAHSEAEHIVFCGVRFMAEAAAVLARPGQRIYHPEPEAGCPMADMVDLADLRVAMETLTDLLGARGVIPLVYMNSSASVKAFCGIEGGAVCTSSNAAKAFEWAFENADRILFVPDEHLGRNTSLDMGIEPDRIIVWDPAAGPLGGHTPDTVTKAEVILWKGYCHVHTWFNAAHVEEARNAFPDALVVVHPECTRDVVEAADGVGSTGYLAGAVRDAAPGSTIVVGTEGNLVRRLALEYPDRKVVGLARSICPNMFRITLRHVRDTVAGLGELNEVVVSEDVRRGATLALDRMLSLTQ